MSDLLTGMLSIFIFLATLLSLLKMKTRIEIIAATLAITGLAMCSILRLVVKADIKEELELLIFFSTLFSLPVQCCREGIDDSPIRRLMAFTTYIVMILAAVIVITLMTSDFNTLSALAYSS